MNKLIRDVHNALQNSRKTVEFLNQNSSWIWMGDYPIAVVNEKSRIKDAKDLELLEEMNFFDADGFSKNSYTKQELDSLKESVPAAMKTSYCLCLKKKQNELYTFKEKFEHDQWKKIKDEDNFEAFMEFSKFNDTYDSKTIETQLRDIMRSSKEIPSLKRIGFVWIATVANSINIEDILEHYFLDNHIYIEQGRKTTYIAWSPTLSSINMRYFVNTP